MAETEVIEVDFADAQYNVYIGRELINDVIDVLKNATESRQVLIVADSFFAEGYVADIEQRLDAEGFSVTKSIMDGGKVSKTFNEVLKIYGLLEDNNFSRDATIIALGGGVIGDLAGFSASTWYRGMNLVHMPSTLMGMVDSSVGGKVAVNFRATVNAVGNYHHPIGIISDTRLVDTLSQRDYVAGMAEVVKCALIADKQLFDFLWDNRDAILARDPKSLVYCIQRAIEIKVDHVKNDVREGGKRLKLNFGHTLGHAIEMATQSDQGELFRHGEGVSLGMAAIMEVSHDKLGLARSEIDRVLKLLEAYNLPTSFSAAKYGFERSALIEECMQLTKRDKKRKSNALRVILIDTIGSSSIHLGGVSTSTIESAFEAVIKD